LGNPDKDPRIIKEIKTLGAAGYDIYSLCWHASNDMSDNLADVNYTKINLPLPKVNGTLCIILWPVWWLYVLFSLIRVDCDIIHALNYNSIFPSLVAGKLKRIPVIYEIMDISYDAIEMPSALKRTIVYLDKLFMRFSDSVIIVDENQLKQLGGIPNSHISVIYDSALDVFDSNLPHSRKQHINEFTILYVGVLYKIRHLNIDTLCHAIKNIQGVQLIIAGYGDLVEDINMWASQSNGSINFIGRISYSEALRRSMGADALVVLRDSNIRTNRYICGSKIWEAMMCGKPILVNKGTSTANKVLETNCGLVVDANNVEEIKDAIITLRDNPELCNELGANGRRAYETQYSWEIMGKNLVDCYKELICEKM